MPRFVALLRGVNVGNAKRVAMADLRALLESLGYSNVTTLLNSGNAVFDGPAETRSRHAQRIQGAVRNELGVDCLVIVKTAKDMSAVVAGNALKNREVDPSRLLVALTTDSDALLTIAALAELEWGAEEIHVGKHAAYVWCANGILESKVAVALLKGLATSGTTRNWSTIERILRVLCDHA